MVRLMTPADGLQAAYVRGARGRRMRPVLMPGNQVQARLRSRTEEQLAHAEIELSHSRAPLLSEPLPAAAIDWVTALTAVALPEAQPFPRLYDALDALLALIEAAPSALGWAGLLVRYELLLLAELGFGLDLESCAVSKIWPRLAPGPGARSVPLKPSPTPVSYSCFLPSFAKAAQRAGPRFAMVSNSVVISSCATRLPAARLGLWKHDPG